MRFALMVMAFWMPVAAAGQEPGWRFSPLPGEGDRAALGCDRDAAADDFACLAVRCEDDFSVGVHVWSSREKGGEGRWEMTADRENFSGEAVADEGPYGARFAAGDAEWLQERLRHGAFVYLRHGEDQDSAFRFIDLTGSMRAINTALAFCAPRVPPSLEGE